MPEISEQDFQNLKDQVQALANQLNQARNRIEELEEFATDHIGLDWGETLVDINSPHPNMSVNTLESGGGTIRQDVNGMQIQTNATATRAIRFMETLQSDPSTVYPRGELYGSTNAGTSTYIALSALDSTAGYADATAYIDQDEAYVQLDSSFDGTGNDAVIKVRTTATRKEVKLSGDCVLTLIQVVADPSFTLEDGDTWYRTDLDRARLRANGASRSLALENTLIHGDGSELTIAAGAITITTGYHRVDTTSDGASSDLDTISGGATGQILVIRAENTARSVVAKDGTGNLKLAGDCTLDNTEDTLTLIYNGTNWLELSRSDNGA